VARIKSCKGLLILDRRIPLKKVQQGRYILIALGKEAHEQVATKKLNLSFFHVHSVVIKRPSWKAFPPKEKGY
jgi:hypothetical protein